jgi:hypothetical protein
MPSVDVLIDDRFAGNDFVDVASIRNAIPFIHHRARSKLIDFSDHQSDSIRFAFLIKCGTLPLSALCVDSHNQMEGVELLLKEL